MSAPRFRLVETEYYWRWSVQERTVFGWVHRNTLSGSEEEVRNQLRILENPKIIYANELEEGQSV